MDAITIRNTTPLPFRELVGEVWRRYTFPDNTVVTVNAVRYLAVVDNGNHFLLDATGRSHFIPSGWNHLEWTVEPDAPHFSVGRRSDN